MATIRTCTRYATLAVAVGLLFSVSSGFADDSSEKMLDFLRHGYLDNREKLRSFDCQFIVVEGTAKSIEDAIQGKLESITRKRNGIWVVKDDLERYELLCSAPVRLPDFSRAKPGEWVGSPCDSVKFLTNESLKMSYTEGLRLANLSPTRLNSPGILITPISMGAMGSDEVRNPASLTFATITGSGFRRYEGQTRVDGKMLHVVAIGEEGTAGKEWWQKWLMDPEQGYLPVEVWYSSIGVKRSNQTIVTEMRRCANGAFIPEKSVEIRYPDGPGPFGVCLIELVKFDLSGPGDELFAIDLPERTRILNPADTRAFVKLGQSEIIKVADLDTWYDRCNAESQAKTPVPPLADKPGGKSYFIYANIAVIIALVAAIYIRHHQSKV